MAEHLYRTASSEGPGAGPSNGSGGSAGPGTGSGSTKKDENVIDADWSEAN
ncbi:MAG: hypothetical protein HC923_02075 [Myxococcales bacterium]|nr:hypothetical protein [Myxococcales bacterium]